MSSRENLNQYIDTYRNDPFHAENQRGLNRYIEYCLQSSVQSCNYLELGIGHGTTLNALRQYFKHVTVLEGASELVKEYQHKYNNVDVIASYFETFCCPDKFDYIGMGFILEHVENPESILCQYKDLMSDNGRIFIGVPSASSMHRLLAQEAGLLNNIEQLSETDIAFGHKRLWTYTRWQKLLTDCGFRIEKAYGLAFKPFTTAQLNQLNLDSAIFDALDNLSRHYPELANSLFFEVSHA